MICMRSSLVLVYLPLPCDIYPRNSMTTRIKSILADLTYFILYFTYISLGYFTLLYFGRLQYTVKYLSIKKDGDSSHILNKCSTVNTTNKRTKTNFDFNPSLHWGVFLKSRKYFFKKALQNFLTSGPPLNETVFGVSTRWKIYSRAFQNNILYYSDAEFFGKTNGEVRNRLVFIV